MGDPLTRARDADRNAVVELLQEAYVDGQLDAEARDARVERALAAATMGELSELTRDLQRQPAPPRRRLPVALAAAAAILVAGVVGLVVALTGGDDPEPAPEAKPAPAPVVVGQPTREPSPSPTPTPTPTVAEPTYELSLKDLRLFRERYEEKFGTTETYDTTFRPDRISVEVPVRGTRPRYESWTYDGTFARTSGPSAVSTGGILVDMRDVDFAAMIANITVAERTLNVQKGTMTHIIFDQIDASGEGPEVDIYVANDYREGGRLTTRPNGTIIQRWPYEP